MGNNHHLRANRFLFFVPESCTSRFTPFLVIFFIQISIIFPGFYANAQSTDMPFEDGEKLFYRVSYNWEFVWVDAGKVEFTVSTITLDGLAYWFFQSSGKSLTAYDWLFKVRDNFKSVAAIETFSPRWYERKTIEGDYITNNSLEFIPEKNVIICETENSNKAFSRDTLLYSPDVYDLETAVYYARTFDFSLMTPGDEIPLEVIVDGKVYNLSGSFIGNETVENYNGKIYQCHRFEVTLVEGTIFKAGDTASIWVTADKNKIPVLIEAGILVGSVKAYFVGGKNLKYPLEALLN
ncbi:MAG: DUF3108 domain-containing protein [Bacteroidales bacterium]|nr:DUF3108 domain-containing protein [Bacteroidales bacterium]